MLLTKDELRSLIELKHQSPHTLLGMHPLAACIVTMIWLAQLAMMERLLEMPTSRARWFGGRGVALYMLGMLIAAWALRSGLTG